MSASTCNQCCPICRGVEAVDAPWILGTPCLAHRPEGWAPTIPLVDPNGLTCCITCLQPLADEIMNLVENMILAEDAEDAEDADDAM
jgi:hypothetical protein